MTVCDSVGTDLGVCDIIYAINYVWVCMRPEMALEIGFKKWNQCLISGLPMDSPPALFWDFKKKSRVWVNWTKNVHMLYMELFKRNGLS